MPRPILVSIEGNIGSGKSTLLDTLKTQYPQYHYIPEPVSEWFTYKNDCGKNILELFYQDKQRYAYTFQTMAFITRVINISNAIKVWEAECATNPDSAINNVFVTERCIETDYNVFAKMLYDDKVINKVEMDLYLTWFNHLKERCEITGVVHVVTCPNVCKERISIRNRSGEEGIPMEYLESLDKYHNMWLNDFHVPIMRYVNVGDQQNCVEDVATFISTL